MRDRMAGPENGLFFPIRPNKMLWRIRGVISQTSLLCSAWKTGAACEFRYRV